MEDAKLMNGILPLWKPKGMTSHDCVQKTRHLLGIRKVGHTGTLDPNVEGVLPICIGEATKLVPFLTPLPKEYIAECTLGVATETEDSDGRVIAEQKISTPIPLKHIDEVLHAFHGEITQIPPMYSAVRVKGKRLYEYARANIAVERPERKVKIFTIKNQTTTDEIMNKINFTVRCSSGTYIRTLCVDIGKALGYPAHMSALVRTESSSFTAKETVTFADIQKAKQENRWDHVLAPLIRGVQHMGQMIIDDSLRERIFHGQKLPWDDEVMESSPFAITIKEQLLAIYERHPSKEHVAKPIRVFHQLNEW